MSTRRLERLADVASAVAIALVMSWAWLVWPHCAGVCS